MNRSRASGAVLLFCALLGLTALLFHGRRSDAQGTTAGTQNVLVVNEVDSAPATYRSSVAYNDSAALDDAATAALTTITFGGKQVLRVVGRFSVSAGSCLLTLCRGRTEGGTWKTYDHTDRSIAASTTWTNGALFEADATAFDAGPYPYAKLKVSGISQGTVTLVISKQ